SGCCASRGGVSSCKNFALNFQGASRRKTGQKFLQKGWAAQGFKGKKRHPAGAKQKKLSQPNLKCERNSVAIGAQSPP
ncbi:hypothetical protein, partial [Campylobacter sp.]